MLSAFKRSPGASDGAFQAFAPLLPSLAGLAVAVLGVLVLLGWWQDIAWLRRGAAEFAPFLPVSAFALLLAGLALVLATGQGGDWRKRLSRLLAVVVLYCGLEAFHDVLLGRPGVLHALLLPATAGGFQAMSEVLGCCLLLAGLCLLLTGSSALLPRRIVIHAATSGLVLALASFIGYLYGSATMLGEGLLQPISLHASLGFLLLFCGLLLLNAESGWPGILAGSRPAASSARRLLAVLILVFLGVAWGAEYGELQGWYDKEFRLALLSLLTLLLLTVLVLQFSRRTAQLYEVQLDAAEALRAGEARVRRAADEANQRKDEFLATLGHELRNPLAPILSSAELLKALTAADPAARELTAILERQVQHMTHLVDDLLDVSRITLGRISLRKTRVPLGDVIADAVQASRGQLDKAGLQLRLDLPEQALEVEGDTTRLTQVVLNLLSNAIKYTPPGGAIEVAAGGEGGGAWIRVRDNGVGIAPASLQEIFGMFRQVGSRDQRHGLGIGLALTRALVELHGGQIEVQSEGEGRGSEFRVLLPLLTPQASRGSEPIETQAHAARDPGRARVRVLLVDDNEDALLLLALQLRHCGLEVETAADGPAALRCSAAFRPQAVILDIGLPGMDGYTVARQLRADPQQAGVLLIALTGWGQASDKQEAQAAGFDHHFTKPADSAALLALLRKAGAETCRAGEDKSLADDAALATPRESSIPP